MLHIVYTLHSSSNEHKVLKKIIQYCHSLTNICHVNNKSRFYVIAFLEGLVYISNNLETIGRFCMIFPGI